MGASIIVLKLRGKGKWWQCWVGWSLGLRCRNCDVLLRRWSTCLCMHGSISVFHPFGVTPAWHDKNRPLWPISRCLAQKQGSYSTLVKPNKKWPSAEFPLQRGACRTGAYLRSDKSSLLLDSRWSDWDVISLLPQRVGWTRGWEKLGWWGLMRLASDLSTGISEEGSRRICFGAGWLTSSLRPVNSGMVRGERPGLKCRLYIILCERTWVSGVLRWHFVVRINRVSRSEPSAPLTRLHIHPRRPPQVLTSGRLS